MHREKHESSALQSVACTYNAQLLKGTEAFAGVGAERRYAVIGGGFAGVATAWHLLAHAKRPVRVDLFDGAGIAGGASGAAAGLLHPYSRKGKASSQTFPCNQAPIEEAFDICRCIWGVPDKQSNG